MSPVHTENYQSQRNPSIAQQRLATSRQELRLYTHLLQASLVVERNNPLRQALNAHPHLVRNVTVTVVILLSIIAGVLAPQLVQTMGGF